MWARLPESRGPGRRGHGESVLLRDTESCLPLFYKGLSGRASAGPWLCRLCVVEMLASFPLLGSPCSPRDALSGGLQRGGERPPPCVSQPAKPGPVVTSLWAGIQEVAAPVAGGTFQAVTEMRFARSPRLQTPTRSPSRTPWGVTSSDPHFRLCFF